MNWPFSMELWFLLVGKSNISHTLWPILLKSPIYPFSPNYSGINIKYTQLSIQLTDKVLYGYLSKSSKSTLPQMGGEGGGVGEQPDSEEKCPNLKKKKNLREKKGLHVPISKNKL